MRITVNNITDLKDKAQELIDACEEWLDMQEDRASYEADDIRAARETMEDQINDMGAMLK